MKKNQKGIALIAVLWVVAALSIITSSLSQTIRGQIKITSTAQDIAQGTAIAEGAMYIALQKIPYNQNPTSQGPINTQITYRGITAQIQISSLSGLISINYSSAVPIALLIKERAGLSAAKAQELAETIIKWREASPKIDPTSKLAQQANRPQRIESVHDLMLIPQMSYEIYEKIAPYISAETSQGHGLDIKNAPPELLAAFKGEEKYLSSPYTENLYKVKIQIPIEEGKILQIEQDIALNQSSQTQSVRILQKKHQITQTKN